MLHNRALRLSHFVPLGQSKLVFTRCNASRQFSSLPRLQSFQPLHRPQSLKSSRPRMSTTRTHNIGLTALSARNASWWSWGKSNTSSAPDNQSPVSDYAPELVMADDQPMVTSNTPEIAPAGINRPAVLDEPRAIGNEADAMEELLGREPIKDVLPPAQSDLHHVVDYAGQLKDLGLDYGWGGTAVFESLIEHIYLSTGLGWAGCIIASSAIVRCLIFYFQLRTSDQMAAISALQPIMTPLTQKRQEALEKGDQQTADLYQMQMTQLGAPHKKALTNTALFMAGQMYIGFCAFRCLRAMCSLPVPGMEHDGYLWFVDMTVRDPYFLLPLSTTAFMYMLFQRGGETGVQQDSGPFGGANRKKLFTFMAVMLGVITAFQPAGLQLYFLTTAVYGALTGYLLRQNGFRSLVGIRLLPNKQSQEAYTRRVMEIQGVPKKQMHGSAQYQAPTLKSTIPLSGIKVKEGTKLPAHLKVPPPPKTITEEDFELGPRGTIVNRISWYRRHYRFRNAFKGVGDKLESWQRKQEFGRNMTIEQAAKKRKAIKYEEERRRRFENRK